MAVVWCVLLLLAHSLKCPRQHLCCSHLRSAPLLGEASLCLRGPSCSHSVSSHLHSRISTPCQPWPNFSSLLVYTYVCFPVASGLQASPCPETHSLREQQKKKPQELGGLPEDILCPGKTPRLPEETPGPHWHLPGRYPEEPNQTLDLNKNLNWIYSGRKGTNGPKVGTILTFPFNKALHPLRRHLVLLKAYLKCTNKNTNIHSFKLHFW